MLPPSQLLWMGHLSSASFMGSVNVLVKTSLPAWYHVGLAAGSSCWSGLPARAKAALVKARCCGNPKEGPRALCRPPVPTGHLTWAPANTPGLLQVLRTERLPGFQERAVAPADCQAQPPHSGHFLGPPPGLGFYLQAQCSMPGLWRSQGGRMTGWSSWRGSVSCPWKVAINLHSEKSRSQEAGRPCAHSTTPWPHKSVHVLPLPCLSLLIHFQDFPFPAVMC